MKSIKKKVLPPKEPSAQSGKSEQETTISQTDQIAVLGNSPLKIKGKHAVNPFPVVAIGASAGGLEAVTELLQNLSPTTGMAFIYVQHLSPDHKSLLPEILSKLTPMKVQEIDDMEKIQPDNLYVIPYNKEIEVIDGHIQLLPRKKIKSSNLSIDVLFSSLAETHKENVVGIVLSGSAHDGTRGLKEIKQAGGITFAQDDSAKFSSMPQSAIAEGVVDFVMSPKEVALELNWMSEHPLVRRPAVKHIPENEIENNNPDLRTILQLIRKRKGVDFSHYKMNTIKRRMLRRMLVHKIKTIKQYAGFLEQNEKEVDLLYQDLLINVSDFFRDTEAFALLKSDVLPKLLKNKAPEEPLRIWVAACATGEEVYSIAILLFEIQGSKGINFPFQIFASDLSAEALNVARNGEYSPQQLKNVSPKRLQQFFTKSKDHYRISKYLRDICVFAQHNILIDPPFSRMDFISCRNFLIYLDTSAQKKALSTFHYALNESGCLMLGKSETIGNSTALFTPLNKKYKVYTRKKNSGVQSNGS
ncbi:MAG: CheR family methyltransferase [Saprospiraceae bacterium]|nr:CheR family methyltransferase [Saprospiraceae bacterium]